MFLFNILLSDNSIKNIAKNATEILIFDALRRGV